MAGKNGHCIVRSVSTVVNDYNAINIHQLREMGQTHNGVYQYLNKCIDHLNNKLTPSIASTKAISSITQGYQPNSNLAGVAVSSYSYLLSTFKN
ncbi:MAG TPA: hypothetical protein ACHBX0_15195 [Arsenophonus sp.]